MSMSRLRLFATMLIVCFVILEPVPASSALASDEAERAQRAARVIQEILRAEDQTVPEALMTRAKAIAVIPHVVKGAFLVGGRFGKALVTQRLDSSWSAPAFVDIGGASVGFQVGVEATDLVLVFIEKNGLQALLEDKLKLGADASVSAGPVGRKTEAGTNLTLDAAIYSYPRSKGLFAGVALDGLVLTIDDSANENVYGSRSRPRPSWRWTSHPKP